MTGFYEKIKELGAFPRHVSATVLAGDHIGEKGILEKGHVVFLSEKDGFLASHQNDLEAAASAMSQASGQALSGEISSSTAASVAAIAGVPVFLEPLGADSKIVICGAGHVAYALLSMAKMTKFEVSVVEDRREFASAAEDAGADRVICAPFEEALGQINGDNETYFVIMTRGHHYDMDCLKAIAEKPCAYIGMMGSRRRISIVKEKMAEAGVPAQVLQELHAPIGLAIGAETPQEIAVSVMAEIIQVRHEKRHSFGYPKDLLKAITEETGQTSPASVRKILATIVRRRGSAPRTAGTKMLIREDGSAVGTIGGGSLEAAVTERAMKLFSETRTDGSAKAADRSGKEIVPELFRADLQADAAECEGMVCGGMIDVFLESC